MGRGLSDQQKQILVAVANSYTSIQYREVAYILFGHRRSYRRRQRQWQRFGYDDWEWRWTGFKTDDDDDDEWERRPWTGKTDDDDGCKPLTASQRATMSRCISRLKSRGLVTVQGRSISATESGIAEAIKAGAEPPSEADKRSRAQELKELEAIVLRGLGRSIG